MNLKSCPEAFSFRNFHQGTVAEFSPSDTPPREPDFVSGSGSAYWDDGRGVFRSSDHWAGMNGCTGQASCRWSILDAVRPGVWITGYCAYSGFSRRGATILEAVSFGSDDVLLARDILAAGGVLVDRSRFPKPVPPWARLSLRGSIYAAREAEAVFDADPTARRAISASKEVISKILLTSI